MMEELLELTPHNPSPPTRFALDLDPDFGSADHSPSHLHGNARHAAMFPTTHDNGTHAGAVWEGCNGDRKGRNDGMPCIAWKSGTGAWLCWYCLEPTKI